MHFQVFIVKIAYKIFDLLLNNLHKTPKKFFQNTSKVTELLLSLTKKPGFDIIYGVYNNPNGKECLK